ncbi:DUF6461 domain-containing protein [Acrocarpospora phusangensis]|uniref:DUF6461 domain-containing protein n=1 Tax=Acrocarpospora phusangensis TaxID=1070424 RepID=UPI001950385C|nr:DUF6461 domain-containing protein [Acrocarpospora phusangensis]
MSEAEAEAAAQAPRLIAAVGDTGEEGLRLACVAGITAADAARRLAAVPADPEVVEALIDDPWSDIDGGDLIVGATDVPGGCVLTQPWGYALTLPAVTKALSAGTVCYSLFVNPKSGNQGQVTRDGVVVDSDTHPGGGDAGGHLSAEEILAVYLYQGQAVAYCCAGAGVRPEDARAIAGGPDVWLRL